MTTVKPPEAPGSKRPLITKNKTTRGGILSALDSYAPEQPK